MREDDEIIEYHFGHTPDGCSITLTIKAEYPISQAEYENMLLCLVNDMKKGRASGNAEWILDDPEMTMN